MKICLLGLCVVCLVTGQNFAHSADAPTEAIPGERLDPTTYGPSVIESMSEMIERDRLAPTETASGAGRSGRQGRWVVPTLNATSTPHSGIHNVVNEWGDTRMGIGFSELVDVECAFFSGQAADGVWTTGVRVVGYRAGSEVASTDWFTEIGPEPALFEIGLKAVDRIEIQSVPKTQGGGWYAMDDFAYTRQSTSPGPERETVVLDFEDCVYKQTLTDSAYAGLTWETGTGDFRSEWGVPAPRTMPDAEPEMRPGPAGAVEVRGGGGTPPTLVSQFQGVVRGDAGQFSYPPDTCGAVGPNHFVETVNNNFSIYLKSTGVRVTNSRMTTFLPGSSGDPRVLYDTYSGRWVVINSDFNTRVYLAVSMTGDPTGSWFKTSILASSGIDAGSFPDYPTLGANADGIYVASWLYPGTMTIFAIDKAPLVAPSPSLGTVTAFRGLPFEGAIQPVQAYGPLPVEYLVSRTSSSLRVRQVSGPMTAPTLTELGFVPIPLNSNPSDVPSLGSGTPLDSVDGRLMNAVFRDGSIWTAHAIDVGGRAACRWYEADVAGMTLVQHGTIADGVRHYFFPSIAVNERGDAAMGFSGSHAGQFAACYYTARLSIDPPGEMAPPALLRAGAAAQNNLDQFGRNRWGDYSLTTVDPVNDRLFWTIQEYAHANDLWGTHIGQLGYPDCNGNGIDDDLDIAGGTSTDCNLNMLPDECELAGNDCDANQTPDDCQIAGGTSVDCDADGTPDECELDCNNNNTADDCDIAAGTSGDCQSNLVPDECEIAAGTSIDCTGNGTPDECEADCNLNGIRDDCDLAAGTSHDCDSNGLLDDCEIAADSVYDCNANGYPDGCDLASGFSDDCDANTVPDECESEVCAGAWGGFESDPPFAVGTFMHGLDTDGDGSAWQNISNTATINNTGCPGGAGKALKSVAQTPNPADFFPLTSEFFRTVGGQLPAGSPIWSVTFDARTEASLNPRIDWQMALKDGANNATVILLHWASTQSAFTGVSAAQRGRLLVQNPLGGSPAFLSTNFAFTLNACYSVRVDFNNITRRVDVYVNGTLRLTTVAMHVTAQRMDYFKLEQRGNNQAAGGVNRLGLDNFQVCQTGAAPTPGGAPDCNGNSVWDECDIAGGGSVDLNLNGIPDECETPAATVIGAVSRKTCDLPLVPARQSEPRSGGVTEVRIAFNVPPGGPGATPVTLEQATCAAPAFAPYSGAAATSAAIAGNELVVSFSPALENLRTYRLNIAGSVTSVAGQFVEVRGLTADVNSDGNVNATDRSVVVGAWTGGGFSCATDVNGDAATNATDRSIVVGAWTGAANCAP